MLQILRSFFHINYSHLCFVLYVTQDSQAKHVERAIDVVRMDNSSWRLQQRLNHSQEIAHAILREQYGADPGAHHMAK